MGKRRKPKPPNLLVVGVQKSATSWLYRRLDEHPEVWVLPEKETFHYWLDQRPFEEYLEAFADAPRRAKWRGEVATGYYGSEEACKRIAHDFPEELVLLAILRHPVERAISAYFHHVRRNRIDANVGIMDVVDKYGIRGFSQYELHNPMWEKRFPGDFSTLFYDHVETEPAALLGDLCTALGIERNVDFDTSTFHNKHFDLSSNPDEIRVVRNHKTKTDVENGPYVTSEEVEKLVELLQPTITWATGKWPHLDWAERTTTETLFRGRLHAPDDRGNDTP